MLPGTGPMNRPEAKILIIDDDPNITDLLSDILTQDGYKVIVCNSSRDALYMAQQIVPDLLLLDLMMPEMDGFDVCEFFKQDPVLKLSRIVILSVRDFPESRIKGYHVGADAYLSKPFQLDELREIIRRQILSKSEYDQTIHDLQDQNVLDPVTGSYNRKYLADRIAQEIKRNNRYDRKMSLLLFDLDRFKTMNLRYGYSFGNEILKNVVQTIKEQLRESDVIGRYEEDAFLVLLPETSKKDAETVASRIHETLSTLVSPKNKPLGLLATIATVEADKTSNTEDSIKKLEEHLKTAQAKKLM